MNSTDLGPIANPASLAPRKSRVRAFAWLSLVTLLGVGGAAYFGAHTASAGEHAAAPAATAPPPPKVTVAPVEERTITDHRELLGRVEPIESVEIRPRVSGHIENVRLQAGQSVKKGDVLFTIDPAGIRPSSIWRRPVWKRPA